MSCITSIEKPNILSPLDVMVLLLNEGPITGFTRLDKMLFLVSKDKTLQSLPSYNFEHGNFGPYSSEAYDDLLALKILKGIGTKNLGDFGNYIERVDEDFIEKELDDEVSLYECYPLEVLTLNDKVKEHVAFMRENLTVEQQKALTKLYLLWVHKPLGLVLTFIYSAYYDSPLPVVDSVVYKEAKKYSRKRWQFWKKTTNETILTPKEAKP